MTVPVVGLTGGIASGKSTVARAFVESGIPVVDADQLAREVVAPGTEGLQAVVEAFGEGVLLPDATLDLNYGGGQIQVVLAPTAGDITGNVQNSHGDPATSVQVTAVPVSGSLRKDMNKLVTTDAIIKKIFNAVPVP